MSSAPRSVLPLLALLVPACGGVAREPGALPVLERRAALAAQATRGPAAIPTVAAALEDGSPLVRRQAARLLLEMGEPARVPLLCAMGNDDLLVRCTALKVTWKLPAAEALPYLEKALGDESVLVRQAAVSRLTTIRPQTPDVSRLLEAAGRGKDDAVRLPALKALWPFHRDNVSLRDRADYDQDVRVVQAIRLPKDGWRFRLDPERDGHTKGWFQPGFDDSSWQAIAIEQAWQKAGVEHVGVAWYRRWIELPPRPKEMAAADLHFQGVDECAWVWVNGVYIGQHDIGPQGWDRPFRLDVTAELKWGERNQITVRAMNTAQAGGIWRPVAIEVLK